jgi:hypothetical protein
VPAWLPGRDPVLVAFVDRSGATSDSKRAENRLVLLWKQAIQDGEG